MQQFSFEKTNIDDLIIVNPFYSEDERGCFVKSIEKDVFRENGIEMDVFEYFESISSKGVIRGLHFQTENPQAKLIKVPYGEIIDVAVDLRKNSKTFGKWYSINLSDKNKKLFYIPKGFAHGFLVLSNTAIVSYFCDSKYSPETDDGIIWNDEDLDINWQLEGNDKVIISERDQGLGSFKQFSENIWTGAI